MINFVKQNIAILKTKKFAKLVFVICSYTAYIGITAFLILRYYDLNKKSSEIHTKVNELSAEQQNFKSNFEEELFNEHLALLDKNKTQSELDNISTQLEKLSLTQQGSFALTVDKIYGLYEDFQAKLKRNSGVKIDNKSSEAIAIGWGQMLIDQKFTEIETQITEQNTALDSEYKKYVDSLPKPAPVAAGNGYSGQTVTTERGTTHSVYLVKMPLSQVRVKTIAAIEDDCSDNCATKSLEQYVKDNNGVAGINGSYNCPPDYSACSGKVNSFDYAFYDSNDEKWFNKDARSWSDTGMVTFSGHSYNFYKKSSEYDGDSVDAAISNYPSLLKNGEVVVDDDDLTAHQKVKGLRGALGLGGENIYLVQIANASVIDAAYVLKALGAQHGLNLDGGGSAALYTNGGYVIGPGRSLSNAIVLVR